VYWMGVPVKVLAPAEMSACLSLKNELCELKNLFLHLVFSLYSCVMVI